MEMVSTAKMKKMQSKLDMLRPFSQKIDQIITNLRQSGVEDVFDVLLQEHPNPTRALILLITSNRGLCGGFNTGVIDLALEHKRKLAVEEGKEVLLYTIGKKANSYLRFINEPVYKYVPNFEDKITFNDALAIGNELINLFIRELDEVYVVYTKVLSSSTHRPEIIRLLPIATEDKVVKDSADEFHTQYIFEPNPYRIFQALLPFYVKAKLYSCLVESGFSEQVARRVAMKNATDAATEMVRELTIKYNRVRQAKITNEIAEIVGGASALE